MFRDPLSTLARQAAAAAPVAMAAPTFSTRIDVPIWPSEQKARGAGRAAAA